MRAALAASGVTRRTDAPRARRTWSSTAVLAPSAARSAPSGVCHDRAGRAVGSSRRTSLRSRAGAASAFVTDQAPPSTYSRPPMRTGAKTPGIAQEAATASATDAGRRARRPEDDAAAAAAVDAADPQPAVEAHARPRDGGVELLEPAAAGRDAREHRRPRQPPRGRAERDGGGRERAR